MKMEGVDQKVVQSAFLAIPREHCGWVVRNGAVGEPEEVQNAEELHFVWWGEACSINRAGVDCPMVSRED